MNEQINSALAVWLDEAEGFTTIDIGITRILTRSCLANWCDAGSKLTRKLSKRRTCICSVTRMGSWMWMMFVGFGSSPVAFSISEGLHLWWHGGRWFCLGHALISKGRLQTSMTWFFIMNIEWFLHLWILYMTHRYHLIHYKKVHYHWPIDTCWHLFPKPRCVTPSFEVSQQR